MKKVVFFAVVVLGMLACSEQNGPSNPIAKNGALSGKFSVSESKQVQFSQGNLQYQASTQTWRFAEKQYDLIGYDNSNISDSYSGWIDLFGWGTGNNPTNTSKSNSDYSTFVDWGENAISNGGNDANLWRTLTKDELKYLFGTRKNAAALFGLGKVDSVKGTIILPDNWSTPRGVSFTPNTSKGLKDNGGSFFNQKYDNYSHNTYSVEEWSIMESAGAVFLPAAGYRSGTSTNNINATGDYWSATPDDANNARSIYFYSDSFQPCSYDQRYLGQSVRLVR